MTYNVEYTGSLADTLTSVVITPEHGNAETISVTTLMQNIKIVLSLNR